MENISAALSQKLNFSMDCDCPDKSKYPRLILRKWLLEYGARIEPGR